MLAGGVSAAFLVPVALAAPPGPAATSLRQPLAGAHLAAIPAFSRKYETSCSTCHLTPGKLNAQGEAFRLNGYSFPVAIPGVEEEEGLPLGAEPWKELWPEAIWPGEIPATLPLALHFANDVRVARDGRDGRLAAGYFFPQLVHLQAATTLGQGFAVYLDLGWFAGQGVHLTEAKLKVQDPLPWLPERALNVWVGAQRPHLLTFGDATLDRAARQRFLWQLSSPADWLLRHPTTGEALVSDSRFQLGSARPAVELNGLASGRLYYGIGLAQPSGVGHASDVYTKVRYKLGGIGLDGRVPLGHEPTAWGGQLLDRGLTFEQFTYFGESLRADGGLDRHRSLGFALRAAHERLDLGVGHVRGRNSDPWGVPDLEARRSGTYGRIEYLFFPWLIGSAKLDRIAFRPASASHDLSGLPPQEKARFLPGLVVLLRANIRAVVEGEIFLRDRPDPGQEGANALWLRMDVAF
jgi:hypothetical protein